MIGSNGPRMLAAALPHVHAWNTWYEDYGNTADGFALLNERTSAAVLEAGRDPSEVARSACVFVVLDLGCTERPILPQAPPVQGGPAKIAEHLRELADAGADEAILVVSPITEASIRRLGDVVAAS
jgi:alkanesulfonate monooxygenase SsuD/methylene tetrahydromethanopterin reductase-like flavin-dependent oxidoreductase (luciferase family)